MNGKKIFKNGDIVKKEEFDDAFNQMIPQHDYVDNTIHDMLENLVGDDVEWDISMIAAIRGVALQELATRGHMVSYPGLVHSENGEFATYVEYECEPESDDELTINDVADDNDITSSDIISMISIVADVAKDLIKRYGVGVNTTTTNTKIRDSMIYDRVIALANTVIDNSTRKKITEYGADAIAEISSVVACKILAVLSFDKFVELFSEVITEIFKQHMK